MDSVINQINEAVKKLNDETKHSKIKKCQICNKEFVSYNKMQKYCSVKCYNIIREGKHKYCVDCGKEIRLKSTRCNKCSILHNGSLKHGKGENSPSWKGGRVKHKLGYILIHKPEHPNASKYGYILEHRLVMESKIGRYLKQKEVVHHINGIKDDNRSENLMLFENNAIHQIYHEFNEEIEKFNTGQKFSLAKIINLTITQRERNRKKKLKTSFYCTDAMKCKRQVYYSFKNKDCALPYDANTLRIFDNGNYVHKRIVDYLKISGAFIADEVPYKDIAHNISGRVDLLVDVLGKLTIVEIKSINRGFVRIPLVEHVAQIQLYLYMLQKSKDELENKFSIFNKDIYDIEFEKLNYLEKRILQAKEIDGVILYESKQTNEIFEFKVNLDINIINEIFKQFDEIKSALDSSIPPEKDPSYTEEKYPCKYCPYRNLCFQNERRDKTDTRKSIKAERNTEGS